MVRAHRAAESAADLAALAVAGAVDNGGDPCSRGAGVAAANGARLGSCEVNGREAMVRVTVTGPRWLGQEADLSAEARAGPG
jgi:secretion/DNA translocation related TadE-like protein